MLCPHRQNHALNEHYDQLILVRLRRDFFIIHLLVALLFNSK